MPGEGDPAPAKDRVDQLSRTVSVPRATRNDLRNAQRLAETIGREAELEVLAPVPLSAVCFRYVGRTDGLLHPDELNQKILQRIVRRGQVFLSNASIHGKFALRACFVNHRTTPEDVERIVSEVLAVGRELATGAQA